MASDALSQIPDISSVEDDAVYFFIRATKKMLKNDIMLSCLKKIYIFIFRLLFMVLSVEFSSFFFLYFTIASNFVILYFTS